MFYRIDDVSAKRISNCCRHTDILIKRSQISGVVYCLISLVYYRYLEPSSCHCFFVIDLFTGRSKSLDPSLTDQRNLAIEGICIHELRGFVMQGGVKLADCLHTVSRIALMNSCTGWVTEALDAAVLVADRAAWWVLVAKVYFMGIRE